MKRKAIYQQLVRRYIENKATDREKEIFFHLLAQGRLDKYLQKVMKTKADQLLGSAPQPLDTTTQLRKPTRRIIPAVRYMAAAILIGLLAFTGFLLLKQQKNTLPTASTIFKNEVHPGGNHAILTLGDGSHIVLDTTGDGNLGTQGAAQIIKMDSGALSYKALPNNVNAIAYYNTISTPAGGQYQVTLADGTKVWLNALSTLKFPTSFNGRPGRIVELTGEAYFEVSKDKSKPFRVKVGGMEVNVLGTRFNVNAYADEAAFKTTLLEGSVRLTNRNAALTLSPGQQAQATHTAGQQNIPVTGQQAQARPASPLSIVENADADDAVAWKNGYFSFDDADIHTVMRQLARWYGIRIRYEDNPTKALFWGKMGRDLNLTQVLSGLDKSKVHFQLEGNTLTVLP